jgi:hypothetical protein
MHARPRNRSKNGAAVPAGRPVRGSATLVVLLLLVILIRSDCVLQPA